MDNKKFLSEIHDGSVCKHIMKIDHCISVSPVSVSCDLKMFIKIIALYIYTYLPLLYKFLPIDCTQDNNGESDL